eukprot:Platyproteum_vivax@DN4813_c0_g1_i4.p1
MKVLLIFVFCLLGDGYCYRHKKKAMFIPEEQGNHPRTLDYPPAGQFLMIKRATTTQTTLVRNPKKQNWGMHSQTIFDCEPTDVMKNKKIVEKIMGRIAQKFWRMFISMYWRALLL